MGHIRQIAEAGSRHLSVDSACERADESDCHWETGNVHNYGGLPDLFHYRILVATEMSSVPVISIRRAGGEGGEMTVEVVPITDADVAAVADFLHANLNSRVRRPPGPARYRCRGR